MSSFETNFSKYNNDRVIYIHVGDMVIVRILLLCIDVIIRGTTRAGATMGKRVALGCKAE